MKNSLFVICIAIFTTLSYMVSGQANLSFNNNSSQINGNTSAFVQGAAPFMPCPPPRSIADSIVGSFVNANEATVFGNFSTVTNLMFTCPTTGNGSGFVSIAGSDSNRLRIVWDNIARAQFSCDDNLCPWYANGSSNLNASLTLVAQNIPPGRSAVVAYNYSVITHLNNRPEAFNEDTAYTTGVGLNIDGNNLLPGNFDLPPNIQGRYRGNYIGDQIGSMLVENGDTFTINITAMAYAAINPPGRTPNYERYDIAWAEYFGTMDIAIELVDTGYVYNPNGPLPPFVGGLFNCSNEALYFSVDIGSDAEWSDPNNSGNEVFDPGDIYQWRTNTAASGMVYNDASIFGSDPAPNATASAPLCNPALSIFDPGTVDSVAQHYFDIDGNDRIHIDLNNTTFGPGQRVNYVAGSCIHPPKYMLLSFDEDYAYAFIGNANSNLCVNPIDPDAVMGSALGKDEVLNSIVNIDSVTNRWMVTPAPLYRESEIHTDLSPDPDFTPSGKAFNNDIDALDAYKSSDCLYQYISVDHEARFTDNGVVLRPGVIYQVNDFGSIDPVIDPQLNLGIHPEIDINAFEFAWLPDLSDGGALKLALVFSVDNEDFYSSETQQDTLNPAVLYASFLDGSFFSLSDPVSYMAVDDTAAQAFIPNIDALAFSCRPFTSDSLNIFQPNNPPIDSNGTINNIEGRINDNIDLEVFPNPAKEQLFISYNLKSYARLDLRIFDMSGQELYMKNISKQQAGKHQHIISRDVLKQFSSGMHFVQITVSDGEKSSTYYRKVVIDQ
ncbi:MAG: T9SS type A sorting domain-containing protein [Chitinophagales bacterium]